MKIRIICLALFSINLSGCITASDYTHNLHGPVSATASPKSDAPCPPFGMDSSLARKYALYAMMSSNTYLKSDRTYFPLESLGWTKIDLEGNPTTGHTYTPSFIGNLFSNLQYDIWVNSQENTAVMAVKGTDEKLDWVLSNGAFGISIAYKSAKKHYLAYVKKHPNQHVIMTGHSLGGGIALSVSLWEGPDAIVFDTSPRVFDGNEDSKKPAQRISISHTKDPLGLIRDIYPKYLSIMRPEDIIKASFNFNGESPHRSDLLAEGILRCATSDPALVKFAATLPTKVKCLE